MIPDADRDTQRANRHYLLAGCVLLSLLLHSALLTRWPTPAHPAATAAHSSMAVVLAPQKQLRSESQETSRQASLSPPAPPPAPAVGAESPRRNAVAQLGSESNSFPSPVGAESPRRSDAEIESDPNLIAPLDSSPDPAALAARVGLELARHFHYPSLAVRRGWQGTVLLGFRVGIDGDIEAIHIAQSSGHALLDRAALGALGKVHRVALEHGPLGAALVLQLPVIYRLEES